MEPGLTPPGYSQHKIKIWIVGLLIALATLLVYLPALNNNFVNWDDGEYVYDNPHIQSLDPELLKWTFTSFYAANWHPLTWLSHALDYALWGLNPRGHHLTAIIFHSLNTFLVFILLTRLLVLSRVLVPFGEETEKRKRTPILRDPPLGKAILAGAITALLFGLHPLHVESVAWVAERKDVLYTFFTLLSLLSYLRYVPHLSSPPRRSAFYGLSLFLFALALMSKPMAVTLPVVLVILDIYPLERLNLKAAGPAQRRVWIEKLPFLGLSLVSSIITIVAQRAGGAVAPLKYWPLGARILESIRGLSFYLVKMVWPTDLAPLYPHPPQVSLLNPAYLGALILAICITIFCIRTWPRQKIWSAVWAYYVITLLPVLGIIQVGNQAAADRYTYLPSLGPFLLVGLGTVWIWLKIKRLRMGRLFVVLLLILLIALLTNLTLKQIKVWKNSITLWNHELKIFPNRVPLAYYNRGNAYGKLGNYQRAIKDYDRDIKLDLQDEQAYVNRGVTYEKLGNYQLAIEDFNKAIELDLQDEQAYVNRGATYKKLGNYQLAIEDFDKAIKLDPRCTRAYYNRGNVYGTLGNYQQAIEDYNKAIELDREYVKAYVNRGIIYKKSGNYEQADKDFNKAIALDPQYVQAYINLGIVYAAKGQHKKAIREYKQALKIDPDSIQAYNNLGYLYIDTEINLKEGLNLIKKALSLAPENPSIMDSLGWAYYKNGMFDEALEELKKAIKIGGDRIEFHEHLAKVYERKGKYAEAIKAWKKVLEIDPRHREAQKSLARLNAHGHH